MLFDSFLNCCSCSGVCSFTARSLSSARPREISSSEDPLLWTQGTIIINLNCVAKLYVLIHNLTVSLLRRVRFKNSIDFQFSSVERTYNQTLQKPNTIILMIISINVMKSFASTNFVALYLVD